MTEAYSNQDQVNEYMDRIGITKIKEQAKQVKQKLASESKFKIHQ